jgi:hypothetical protein
MQSKAGRLSASGRGGVATMPIGRANTSHHGQGEQMEAVGAEPSYQRIRILRTNLSAKPIGYKESVRIGD